MTAHDCALTLAALLIIAALFTAALAATEIEPCGDDCRARFQDLKETT